MRTCNLRKNPWFAWLPRWKEDNEKLVKNRCSSSESFIILFSLLEYSLNLSWLKNRSPKRPKLFRNHLCLRWTFLFYYKLCKEYIGGTAHLTIWSLVLQHLAFFTLASGYKSLYVMCYCLILVTNLCTLTFCAFNRAVLQWGIILSIRMAGRIPKVLIEWKYNNLELIAIANIGPA